MRATYDPATRGGDAPDGRKVKSTIHWVSAAHAVDAEVRLYDTLFSVENPDDVPEGVDFIDTLNPDSLEMLSGLQAGALAGRRRRRARATSSSGLGYFCADADDSRPGAPVFNRTVTLKDTWARIEKKGTIRNRSSAGCPRAGSAGHLTRTEDSG